MIGFGKWRTFRGVFKWREVIGFSNVEFIKFLYKYQNDAWTKKWCNLFGCSSFLSTVKKKTFLTNLRSWALKLTEESGIKKWLTKS